MDLLCKLGLHNWEMLDIKTYVQIEEDIEAKIKNRMTMQIDLCGFPRLFKKDYFVKKVCLRCEKFVDEITPYKEKQKPKIKRKIELKRKYS